MKRISYILGIALFILFTAGLLVIGFHAPQGEPPYSYLEAQKEEVSVDSFETRGIRGVEGFWLYDMPDANINIIIRTTNDPRKCRVTYPKDLIRMVRYHDDEQDRDFAFLTNLKAFEGTRRSQPLQESVADRVAPQVAEAAPQD